MWIAENWKDYELIDAGGGEKLERWGNFILRRPDPQAIWQKDSNVKLWEDTHAFYHRSPSGGGEWEFKKNLPPKWQIEFKNLKFNIKPTNFKHTGLFPEQAVNWEWIKEKLQIPSFKTQNPKVLNLFAYTGGATVAALEAGADVVHVDASRGMTDIAKDNVNASGLQDKFVRFIVDDVVKFVQREIRRGSKYQGIIMDPPAFGRGASKEVWEIEKDLEPLIQLSMQLLEDPIFFLANSYANDLSFYSIENIIKTNLVSKFGGKVESNQIGLPISNKRNGIELALPCGASVRWSK